MDEGMATEAVVTNTVHKDAASFDDAFAADIASGVQYADALEQHVTGSNRIRKAACLQTLQALSSLKLDEVQGLLAWAKQQQY